MKIEKINENQIRCTLTQADLAERHLKISELAYGTEKAKSLFRDMMLQASFDFGFEADDRPLMIEAIPSSSDSIVLIITKVEDPEELDTRFSRFTNPVDSEAKEPELFETTDKLEGADKFLNKLDGIEATDEFFDLLDKVKKAATSANRSAASDSNLLEEERFLSESNDEPRMKEKKQNTKEEDSSTKQQDLPIKLFSFSMIDSIIRAAHMIVPIFDGANTLYYDPDTDMYLLAISSMEEDAQSFSKVCNILTEFGNPEKVTAPILGFLEEHCEVYIVDGAVQKLALI